MSLSADKIADLRVKHLDMLQSGVTRMASYSASAKSYSITLLTAIVGFAISTKITQVIYGGFLPIVVFFLLDAQYLRLERRFRFLFDEVRRGNWDSMPDFGFSLDRAPKQWLLKTALSWSVFPFYLLLSFGLGAAIVYMRHNNGGLS